MPSIIINDIDSTQAVAAADNEYAVFIPGLTSVSSAPSVATYFNSLATFKNTFGTSPVIYGTSGEESGEPDRSFIMACELLAAGLPIIYKVIPYSSPVANATTASICTAIKTAGSSFFAEILDRGAFDVSFVTGGGYPAIYGATSSDTFANLLLEVSKSRGDCFAVIDVLSSITITSQATIPAALSSESATITDDLGAADGVTYLPSINITPSNSGYTSDTMMPGSFGYLKAFASSIKSNASWFAVAGLRRGTVDTLGTSYTITSASANALQPSSAGRSLNSIIYLTGNGYVIWGNKTLADNPLGLTASSFVNIRQVVHEIKRTLYTAARNCMFEPNDITLWVNFKAAITPLLDRMQTGQGISSYRLVRTTSTTRATLTAKIIIVPIEAVETLTLTVELTDNIATVVE